MAFATGLPTPRHVLAVITGDEMAELRQYMEKNRALAPLVITNKDK